MLPACRQAGSICLSVDRQLSYGRLFTNLVGAPRFELGTSCSQSKRSSQAELRPAPRHEKDYSIRYRHCQ